MNAAVITQIRLLLLVQFCSKFQLSVAGMCWSTMVKNGYCKELLSNSSTKENCCFNRNLATAWSNQEYDEGTMFFWTRLGDGLPCVPCKESCTGVSCSNGKTCAVRNGRPKCICSKKCHIKKPKVKGPICGTDGRSYRSLCRLQKRSCRKKIDNLSIAYYGTCQISCDKIKCSSGKHCLVDQNMNPHCVRCSRKCPASPTRRQVCGSDGNTYPSGCHIKEMACRKGRAIPIAYKGKCKVSATCNNFSCRDNEVCLDDLKYGMPPRCVTCTKKCPKLKRSSERICGTNNQTYQSWCNMIKDACSKGYIIETKYSGACINSSYT